jgi:hypothetical protein
VEDTDGEGDGDGEVMERGGDGGNGDREIKKCTEE